MAFVKLDTGMLNSTLWIERECRELFITALLMAEPREVHEEMSQIQIRSLEPTGFVVPPGWYGFVEAAGPGIVRRAIMDAEIGLAALERLGSPDPASRSKAFDGRRLVRVDGGFIVLNFIAYREKDATTADRSRRWRERQKLKRHAGGVGPVVWPPTRVTDTPSPVIRHQAEAEAEAEVQGRSNTLVTDVTGVSLEPTTKGSKATRVTGSHLNGAFDAFWSAYPKKSSKLDAVRAWKKVPEGDVAAVMVGLLRDKASEQWARGVIPHPASWLNKRRWEDEVVAPATKLRQAFGQCMWNVHGDRDPREERCDRPGFSERDRVVYCEQHAHLHGERVR